MQTFQIKIPIYIYAWNPTLILVDHIENMYYLKLQGNIYLRNIKVCLIVLLESIYNI